MQEWIDIVFDRVMSRMQGLIVLWSGLITEIPDGWALCDGSNGTPNLENRFIKQATNDDQVGVTGGNAEHSHTFTGDGHSHNFISGPGGFQIGSYLRDDRTDVNQAVGTTISRDHEPPFYMLAFIMKL